MSAKPACLLAPQAQRTKETVPLLKAARRVVLLTGTPALSRPRELYQQLAALLPHRKLTMKVFGERYCMGGNPVQERYSKYQGARRTGGFRV